MRSGRRVRIQAAQLPGATTTTTPATDDHADRHGHPQAEREGDARSVTDSKGERMSSMTMPSPALGSQPPEDAPVKRRSTELWMLLFAFGIVGLAFASTGFGLKGQHPSTFVEYMVAFIVVIGGAHLAIRMWARYTDPLLLPIATVLNGLGLVMVYRLNQAGRNGNDGTHSDRCPHPDFDAQHVRHGPPRSSKFLIIGGAMMIYAVYLAGRRHHGADAESAQREAQAVVEDARTKAELSSRRRSSRPRTCWSRCARRPNAKCASGGAS